MSMSSHWGSRTQPREIPANYIQSCVHGTRNIVYVCPCTRITNTRANRRAYRLFHVLVTQLLVNENTIHGKCNFEKIYLNDSIKMRRRRLKLKLKESDLMDHSPFLFLFLEFVLLFNLTCYFL